MLSASGAQTARPGARPGRGEGSRRSGPPPGARAPQLHAHCSLEAGAYRGGQSRPHVGGAGSSVPRPGLDVAGAPTAPPLRSKRVASAGREAALGLTWACRLSRPGGPGAQGGHRSTGEHFSGRARLPGQGWGTQWGTGERHCTASPKYNPHGVQLVYLKCTLEQRLHIHGSVATVSATRSEDPLGGAEAVSIVWGPAGCFPAV